MVSYGFFFAERQLTVDMADEDEGKARNKEFLCPGRIRDLAASRKEGDRRKGETS